MIFQYTLSLAMHLLLDERNALDYWDIILLAVANNAAVNMGVHVTL